MKRQTAVSNLNKIISKLHCINGIYCAALCDRDFVKVKRAWVFGSVAKGSDSPNDLDIFIEVHNPFQWDQPKRKSQRRMFRNTGPRMKLHGGFKMNKATSGRTVPSAVSGLSEFSKWLKKGTNKTSIHFVHDDDIFNKLDCKHLIYPRNDFKENDDG